MDITSSHFHQSQTFRKDIVMFKNWNKKKIMKVVKVICFGVVPYLVDVAKEYLHKQAGFKNLIVEMPK